MEISFTHPSWVCHTQLLFIFMNKPFLLWNFWPPQSYVPCCFEGCITKNARYFRNIADNEQPEVITAAMCTSTLPICNSSSYVTWSWNQVIFPNSWLVCFGSTQNSSLKLLGTLLRRLHWPESPSTCPAAKPGVCCPFRPSWLSGCRLHFQRAERFFFEKLYRGVDFQGNLLVHCVLTVLESLRLSRTNFFESDCLRWMCHECWYQNATDPWYFWLIFVWQFSPEKHVSNSTFPTLNRHCRKISWLEQEVPLHPFQLYLY